MILYRISNHKDLSGMGGELADGRWHTRQKGRRIVYTSDHPALCILEILVHLDKDEIPGDYQLLRIDVPDRLIESAGPMLSEYRSGALDNILLTQKIGNQWLSGTQKGGLLVPSVLVPFAQNCILNPSLPAIASIKPEVAGRFPFDRRLLSRSRIQ
ncbi:MAG: RES family NAD+ phosphorylase [Acidobacteria bacterium]|nr:RES family NAD+ phosphorylase [Acidobacteriota bacterium]